MKVVILCGGRGTRIRDVAENIPKPMVPVGKYPILWHIMKYYAHFKHDQFVLCLGYKGDVIKDFFVNYDVHTKDVTLTIGKKDSIQYHTDTPESNWKVTLADTGEDAMTGARVKRIKKYVLDDDNFMLTYGDGLGNVDINKLLEFHKAHGKILTVTGVRPPGRFGEVGHDDKGLVTAFNEKPQASGGRISGGFFVCKKEIFNYLNDDENLVFELDPMSKLVKDKQMMLYQHNDFWQPMDTYRDYSYLNSLIEKKQAPWVVWK